MSCVLVSSTLLPTTMYFPKLNAFINAMLKLPLVNNFGRYIFSKHLGPRPYNVPIKMMSFDIVFFLGFWKGCQGASNSHWFFVNKSKMATYVEMKVILSLFLEKCNHKRAIYSLMWKNYVIAFIKFVKNIWHFRFKV